MERRVNKCIAEYFSGFKQNVRTEIIKMIENGRSSPGDAVAHEEALKGLLQYVCDYKKCELSSTDFEKRKRAKNNVPIHEQCCAKKADNSRCTRRKRDGSEYCGTHIKGTPHGTCTLEDTDHGGSGEQTNVIFHGNPVQIQSASQKMKKTEVWLEDIGGIMHYIDNNYNVYDNDDITKGVLKPKVIYKYEKDYINGEEIYKIVV